MISLEKSYFFSCWLNCLFSPSLGGVFASPSARSVYEAIKTVSGKKGCLVLIKNYTGSIHLYLSFPSHFFSLPIFHSGDRLNFGLACERAREEGVNVEMVIVGDDAALEVEGSIPGRFVWRKESL